VISARRPLRGLSALLLLLSPGVGGQALALLHPCPASVAAIAPLAEAGHQMAAMAHHGHAAAVPTPPPAAPADHSEHAGTCDCLGSCHTPALLDSPQAMIVAVAGDVRPAVRSVWPAIESTVPSRPVDRLPPTTAPPSI
jgi:hypothetical protein